MQKKLAHNRTLTSQHLYTKHFVMHFAVASRDGPMKTKYVLDCTVLGYAASYTQGEKTSLAQKKLRSRKNCERGKTQKRNNYNIPEYKM